MLHQRTNTTVTPSPFTGKEKDPETGYSYFGSRYLEHDLMTGWLSVDPMADKYPSLSPYAYCAWNPMKIIDPNGDTIVVCGTIEEQAILKELLDVFKTRCPDNYNKIQSSKIRYNVQYNDDIQDDAGGSFAYDPKSNQFFVNLSRRKTDFTDIEILAHELKHAEQFEDGKIGFLIDLNTLEVTPIAYDQNDELEAAEQANIFANYFEPYQKLKQRVESEYFYLPRESMGVVKYYRDSESGNNIKQSIEQFNRQHLRYKRGHIIIYNKFYDINNLK